MVDYLFDLRDQMLDPHTFWPQFLAERAEEVSQMVNRNILS